MGVPAAGAQEEEGSTACKMPSSALPAGRSNEDHVLLTGKSSKGVQTAAAFLCDPAVFVSAATQTAPWSQVGVETRMAELKPTSGKVPQAPENQVRGCRMLGCLSSLAG